MCIMGGRVCVCEGERDEETPFCICLYKICKTRAAQSFLQGGRISFSVSTKSYLPDEFEKCDLSLKLQGNINNYGRLLLLLITCNLPPQFQLLLLSSGPRSGLHRCLFFRPTWPTFQ